MGPTSPYAAPGRAAVPLASRKISLGESVVYGLGVIIGAGIYALIGEAAGIAGNAMWISFIVAAVVAAFTAMSYCELSSILSKNAAEYHYVKHAFNSDLLGFLMGWVTLVVLVVSAAAVSMGFAGYFSGIFGTPLMLSALGLIVAIGAVNFLGIKLSTRINAALTAVAIGGLVLIIALGAPYFGGVDYLATVAEVKSLADFINPITIAASLIFFAYVGFENIAHVSEETIDAKKVVPRAIQIALTISAVLYVLVAISAVSVVGWQALSESKTPLALVAGRVFGGGASLLLSFIALFATSSTVLVILVSSSRILSGIAKDHSLPDFISKIHPKTGTPYIAILLTTVGSMLFVSMGNFKDIVFVTDFGIFMIFFAVNWSVIAMRFTQPNARRAFRLSVNIGRFPVAAVFGAGFSLFMLSRVSAKAVMTGLPVFGVGLVLYLLVCLRRKKKPSPKKAGGKRWLFVQQ